MLFGVHFSNTGDEELFGSLLGLILNPLVVCLAQLGQSLHSIDVFRVLVCVVVQLQTVSPAGLVQVEKHFLLSFILAVINRNRIIVLVEATHLGNHARRLQVTDV